jgi:hypothetical protein
VAENDEVHRERFEESGIDRHIGDGVTEGIGQSDEH